MIGTKRSDMSRHTKWTIQMTFISLVSSFLCRRFCACSGVDRATRNVNGKSIKVGDISFPCQPE